MTGSFSTHIRPGIPAKGISRHRDETSKTEDFGEQEEVKGRQIPDRARRNAKYPVQQMKQGADTAHP